MSQTSSAVEVDHRRRTSRPFIVVGALFLLLGVGVGAGWSVRWALAHGRAFRLALTSAAETAEESFQLRADQYHYEILASPRYQDPKRLNRYESKVFSQNGEDGITVEIFRRIGSTNRVFAEFGAADGAENNTVLFLNAGWSGLWIDGDPDSVSRMQTNFAPEIQAGRLRPVRGFITAENIETYFSQAKLPPEFDLLSIDIDRNDYWVWKAIQHYKPRMVIIEYNGIFPPSVDWVVEYAADKWWDRTSHFGASLAALERLGNEKGYRLVGCETSGTNAFFVRADLVRDKFQAPFTAENHYEPARYFNAQRRPGHPRRSHGGGNLRLLIPPAPPVQ
jgi:hypothetical protein